MLEIKRSEIVDVEFNPETEWGRAKVIEVELKADGFERVNEGGQGDSYHRQYKKVIK